MKDFVLYSSTEIPRKICEEEFEKYTKNEFPFKQNYDGINHYYATCPECENLVLPQRISLFTTHSEITLI